MVHKGENLAALRFSLKNNGYTPLPNHGKRPVIMRWQDVVVTDAAIARWTRFHSATSTGIRVENGLVVIDFDFAVDWPELADIVEAEIAAIFPDLAQALARTSTGVKRAWFVRLDDKALPFGRIASGLWQEFADDAFDDPDVPRARVEIFGGGGSRQFGAFGPHSYNDDDTVKTEYGWDGPSPRDVRLADLPTVTLAQLDAICSAFDAKMQTNGLTKVVGRRGYGESDFQFVLEAATEIHTHDHGIMTVAELEAYAQDYRLDYVRCSGEFHDESRTRTDTHTMGLGRYGFSIYDFMDGSIYCRIDNEPIEHQYKAEEIAGMMREGLAAAAAAVGQAASADGEGTQPEAATGEHDESEQATAYQPAGVQTGYRRAAPMSDISIVEDEQITLRNAVEWLRAEYAWCSYAYNGRGGVGRLYPGAGSELMTAASFKVLMKAYEITEIGERGGRKKINPVDLWLGSYNKVSVDGWRFRPDLPSGIFFDDGCKYANTYDPPQHFDQEEGDVGPFIAFMKRLVPEQAEREWFFDWMGHKVQHPEIPMVAVAMVAEEFGTGRRTLMEILAGVFGKKYVRPVEFGMLTGTAASARFNSYLAESLLAVIDEAVEEDFYKYGQRRTAYETLKTVVDPNGTALRKYEAKNQAVFFYPSPTSILLATNNRDAMKLPEDDRRFCVVTNGKAMTKAERDAIRAWMVDPANYAALYAFLRDWDTGTFDPFVPPMFTAKWAMVRLGMTPLDEAYELAMQDVVVGELFTVTQVTTEMAKHISTPGSDWVRQAHQMIARKNHRLSDHDPKRRRIKFKGNTEVVFARSTAAAKRYTATPDNEPIRIELMRNEPAQPST